MKTGCWILISLFYLLQSCANSVSPDNRIEQVYNYGSVMYLEYKNSDGSGTKDVFGTIEFKKNTITVNMNVDGQIDKEEYSIRTVTHENNPDELKYRTYKGDFHVKTKDNIISEVDLYAGTFMMTFNKTVPLVKIEVELPIPISTPLKDWKRIEINEVGTIDLSPKLEIQSGQYKEMKLKVKDKAQEIWGIVFEEPKLVIQPKGINDFNETSLSKYCRVIIDTEIGNSNDYQHLNEKIVISATELAELDTEFRKMVQQGFMNTPLKLINWYPLKITVINGMPCIHISYQRQFKDQPYVMVDMYRFLNFDRIHSLTISYRISEKEYWQSTLDNTLKSFRITNLK